MNDVLTRLRSAWRKPFARPLKYLVIGVVWVPTLSGAFCLNSERRPTEAGTPQIVTHLSPDRQSIVQGKSATFTVTVARVNYAGSVTVGQVGLLPRGISVSFSPEVLPEGTTTSTATIHVAPDFELAPDQSPRSVLITISASTPTLVAAEFKILSVEVVSSTVPGLLVNVHPDDYLLYPGTSAEGVVTMSRQGGYKGAVALTVSSAPAGVVATLVPNGSTPDSYILKLATTLSTPVMTDPRSVSLMVVASGLPTFFPNVDVLVIARLIPVSVARTLLQSPAGGQDTVTVRLNRDLGVTGPVALTLVGVSGVPLPDGFTASFSPNPVAGAAALLTVRTTVAARLGHHTLQVVATPPTGIGAKEEIAQFGYTVTAPRIYSLAVSNGSVPQGGSGSTGVVVTRSGGFVAPVALSVRRVDGQPLPAGLSITYDANPAPDDGTTMRFSAAATTPPGVYALVLVGSTFALPDVEQTFNLTVTAAQIPRIIVVGRRLGSTLTPTSSETIQQESTVSLEAAVLDQNNAAIVGAPVTWSPGDASIATVTPAGLVTGMSPGITNVVVSLNSDPTIRSTVVITVQAVATGSNVARIEIEPRDVRITAPAMQQFSVTYFNAAGARIASESGGSLEWSSSNGTVADIDASTGLATGRTAGPTIITARYFRSGVKVAEATTGLTVAASGTAGNYGSVEFSIGGITNRELRVGHGYTGQVIVRTPFGTRVTSGVTPPPNEPPQLTLTPASSGVTLAPSAPPPGAPDGYYFSITVPANATVGSTVQIRSTVTGASGTITLTIVP